MPEDPFLPLRARREREREYQGQDPEKDPQSGPHVQSRINDNMSSKPYNQDLNWKNNVRFHTA